MATATTNGRRSRQKGLAAARRRIEEQVGIDPLEPLSGVDDLGEWERPPGYERPDSDVDRLTRAVIEVTAVLGASMTERVPLTDEQLRVNAAALAAFPRMIQPDDEEMRQTCEGLVERGLLAAVRESDADELDPETDEVVGYVAGEELRAAMLIRAAMN